MADEALEAGGRKHLLEILYGRLGEASYDEEEVVGAWGNEGIPDGVYSIILPADEPRHYPKWQFLGDGFQPRLEMPELLEAAKAAGLDGIGFTNVMLNPEAGNGKSPVELLDEGRIESVLSIIAAQSR